MQAPQTMVYKAPGPHALHGGHFDYLIIDSENVEEALADGWHRTTGEAQAAHDAERAALVPQPEALAPADEIAPPTRAELEAKAAELSITYDKRLGDKKLQALIEDKLKAQAAHESAE